MSLDINKWYQHEDRLPRSQWTSSRIWTPGIHTGLKKKEFDSTKCPLCGGSGFRLEKSKGARKTYVPCECQKRN